MKSWEVLREATNQVGVKAVAAKLRISTALVYKWCQEPTADDPDGSGARNPLDRIRILYEQTRDPRIINWLCQVADGFFVCNPPMQTGSREEYLLGTTQRFVRKFGDLLSNISRSIENDGLITPDESVIIRESWERLKHAAEGFVVACERGDFSCDQRRDYRPQT